MRRGRDGNRGNGNRDNRGDRGNRRDRPPLKWETAERFQEGNVVGIVQYAELENGGRRYSYRIGKESRNDPDKPFPFMDPRDIRSHREVLSQIETWVECDREEMRGGQDLDHHRRVG